MTTKKHNTIEHVSSELEKVGYRPRREEAYALASLLGIDQHGSKALLVEGPPGVGKTFLAESLSKILKAHYLVHLCHTWSDDHEFFAGIHVPAVIAKDIPNIPKMGILTQAAIKSQTVKTVLCLDEIDKTPTRVHNLLFTFLQDGICQIGPGNYVQAKLENLITVITSNKETTLSEPLLRRCRRLEIKPLPNDVLDDLIQKGTGISLSMAAWIRKFALELNAKDESSPVSPQELINLTKEIMHIAQSEGDVKESFKSWVMKTDEGKALLGNYAENYKNLWTMVEQARK